MRGYLAYFKVMVGDQDKSWARIFDSGQKRLESHSSFAFQLPDLNRKIISMIAISLLPAQRESSRKLGIYWFILTLSQQLANSTLQ